MAKLLSIANGNFTSSSTWALCDPTSLLDVETNVTLATTAFQSTQTFTPGAITISGFALKLGSRAVPALGTLTARLFNSTGAAVVAGSTVVINMIDIPACNALQGGYWVYFQFATPITLLAATAYSIQVASSSASQVNIYRDVTVANFLRALVTTTTQAPVDNDEFIITGPVSGPATTTYTFVITASTVSAGATYTNSTQTFTVTNSITSGTSLVTTGPLSPAASGVLTRTSGTGPATITYTSFVASAVTSTTNIAVNVNTTNANTWGKIDINAYGSLNFPTTASTTSHLKLAGSIFVRGGSYSQGSIATPIPATSTANLEFVSSTLSQYGMYSGIPTANTGPQSVITKAGTPVLRSALLNADASIGAVSLTSNVSTGWKTGDQIGIAPTARTSTQYETRTLASNASGTSIPVTALTFAHSGTGLTKAELINVTSNVKVFGQSLTGTGYIRISGVVQYIIDNVEFYFMGSGNANLRGIDIQGTGTQYITNCGFHDMYTGSYDIVTGNVSDNVKFNNNAHFGLGGFFAFSTTTAGFAQECKSNVGIGNNQGAAISSSRTVCTGNAMAGGTATGITFNDDLNLPYGDWSNNTAHSNSAIGMSSSLTGRGDSLFNNQLIYRNGNYGLSAGQTIDSNITNLTSFGNATAGFLFNGGRHSNSYFTGWNVYGEASFAQQAGLYVGTAMVEQVYLDNSTIGSPVTHTLGDIVLSAANTPCDIITRNSTLASPVKVYQPQFLTQGTSIRIARLNGTADNHFIYRRTGVITPDTTLVRVGSASNQSTRLTPNSTVTKLQVPDRIIAIGNGNTATIGVWVRKSNTSAGDAATYNGAQVRLILKANPASGVSTDTVLASSTNAANGAWEFISGVTPAMTDNAGVQVYVDCDGTVGFCSLIDWSVA